MSSNRILTNATICERIDSSHMYTPSEWTCSNEIKCADAVAARQSAQNQVYTCDVTLNEIKKRSERAVADIDKKLDFRLNDINFWMNELMRLIKDNANESDDLYSCIIRLKKALEAINEPLYLAKQCINIRENREGIDLVADAPHCELTKEIDVLCGVKALLTRTIEQAEEQLRLNRKSAYNLKADYRGKSVAKKQDEFARSISTYENIPEGTCCLSASSCCTTEWLNFVRSNLQEGERQIHNSLQMRGIIENILSRSYEDLAHQVEATNQAFKKRVSEIRDAKRKMEDNFSLTLKEISNLEDTIQDIKKAICDTIKVVRITEAKQSIRNCRPVNELCRDAPYYNILEQTDDLQTDLSTLQNTLHDAEEKLKSLRRRQLDLEEEIQLKSNSLHVEEAQVLPIRSSILIQKF